MLREIILMVYLSLSCCEETIYTIGAWAPTTPDGMVEKYTPLFVDYLNREVGMLYSPPAKFRVVGVDYDRYSHADDQIDDGILDFLYSTAGKVACVEPTHEFTTIASARVLVAGHETGAEGSIVFSLKSNSAINNVSDFKNKKIGIGPIISSSAYHLPSKLLQDNGVQIFTDAGQVVHFANDYEGLLAAVLSGKVDGGFTESTWLFQHHPEAVPKLLLHNLQQGKEFQGEAFPFPTSTVLVPQFGFMVHPRVPRRLLEQVRAALMAINGSHPAAVQAGVHRFTAPATYGFSRTVLEDLDLMHSYFDIGQCLNPYGDLTVTISCLPGFVRQPEDAVQVQCQRNGLTCPEGLRCDCRPCMLDLQVTIFSAREVLGLAATLFSLVLFLAVAWVTLVELSNFLPARYFLPDSATKRQRDRNVA